jgi:hypothetical protein
MWATPILALMLLSLVVAVGGRPSSNPSPNAVAATATTPAPVESTPTPAPVEATPTPVPATPAPTPAPTQAPATAAPAAAPARDGSCTPQPCANDNYGWKVYVQAITYDYRSSNQFDRPEAGNVYLKMDLRFENKTDRAQNANPSQFQLLDGAGVIHHSGLGTVDCPYWSSVDVAPGGTFGAKCTVIEATAAKPSPLTLIWTPTLGDYKIKIS